MSEKRINLLMASSTETTTAVKQALGNHHTAIVVHRVDNKQDLHQALESPDWHLVFSDLELSDFSALELASLLGEKKIDVPLVLIMETGAEEIAVRCLESGVSQFIRCNDPYLRNLPVLIDAFLRCAEEETNRRLIEKKLIESEERYISFTRIMSGEKPWATLNKRFNRSVSWMYCTLKVWPAARTVLRVYSTAKHWSKLISSS
jgi:DNA-binding NtrC family response regulator